MSRGALDVYIGVDVGTESVRAACLTIDGALVGRVCSTRIILLRRSLNGTELQEQSSEDLWAAVCKVTTEAMHSAVESAARAGYESVNAVSIAFDATCSLVVLNKDGEPVPVSTGHTLTPSPDHVYNIILWADHRAVEEASNLSAAVSGTAAHASVGGCFSPEHEAPKLIWLAKHCPDVLCAVADGGRALDLTDYLTLRATGTVTAPRPVVPLSSSICKWGCVVDASDRETAPPPTTPTPVDTTGAAAAADPAAIAARAGWEPAFVAALGQAAALLPIVPCAIPTRTPTVLPAAATPLPPEPIISGDSLSLRFVPPGAPVGRVAAAAAAALAVPPTCVVGGGVIDAHAGAVGSVASAILAGARGAMAVVCGTSACHLLATPHPLRVRGVWGPYYAAALPALWCLEGGLSAAGALIDHVTSTHPAYSAAVAAAAAAGEHVYGYLGRRLAEMYCAAAAAHAAPCVAWLWREEHIVPDFHGNRSPHADARARGVMAGLGMGTTVDALAVRYGATVDALAHATRAIVDAIEDAAARQRHEGGDSAVDAAGGCAARVVQSLHFSGSGGTNPLLLQLHADVTGLTVVGPPASARCIDPIASHTKAVDAMIVGSAALAAAAAGKGSVVECAARMQESGIVYSPLGESRDPTRARAYHDARHIVFNALYSALHDADTLIGAALGEPMR